MECVYCGKLAYKRKDTNSYRPYCLNCLNVIRRHGGHHQVWKAKQGLAPCAKCGFQPVHACQTDIDHIDGDHSNNSLSNLEILCANCHRLKTLMSKDHIPATRL